MTEKNIENSVDINLDDPLVMIFRMMMLEKEAKMHGSDLYCPKCKTNLPQRHPFIGFEGTDDWTSKPEESKTYYCGLCDEYF
jgi:hypothetical protein